MNGSMEKVFMQVRILRLAAEEWHMSIQQVNRLFDQYHILDFIADCYDVFHMEGDYAVLEEIEKVLHSKGVDVHAGVG